MDPNRGSSRGGLTGELRLRLPLPIVVPLGALLLIAALAIGFSRILLSVPKEIAVLVAMVTAANIVGACAVLALRRDVNRSVMSELAIVVMYPVIVGAVIATMNLDEAGHGEGETPLGGGDPVMNTASGNTVTASGTAFDTDTLELTAGEANEVTLVNEDTVPHNIAIYTDDSASKEIFVGETITDDETVYSIEAPGKPGEAYFRCDVHPAMEGTVTIK